MRPRVMIFERSADMESSIRQERVKMEVDAMRLGNGQTIACTWLLRCGTLPKVLIEAPAAYARRTATGPAVPVGRTPRSYSPDRSAGGVLYTSRESRMDSIKNLDAKSMNPLPGCSV